MMRNRSLYAIAFALTLFGNAAAQQPPFVERNDNNDPCSRFKLRVLAPAGHIDYKLRVQSPAPDIDPEMVRNPCPRNEPQLAFSPSVVRPNNGDGSSASNPKGFDAARDSGGRGNPPELLLPRMPSAFKIMRRSR